MGLITSIKGFLRAFRSGTGRSAPPHSGHSLATTIKDSTQVRGPSGGAGGNPVAGTDAQHKIVAEGHQRYTDSFEDKNGD